MDGYRAIGGYGRGVPIRSRNIPPGGNSGRNDDIGGAGDCGRKNGVDFNSKTEVRGGNGADIQNRPCDYRITDAQCDRVINCFSCGKTGHMARNCSRMRTRKIIRSGKCLLCSKDDHTSRYCPTPIISDHLPVEETIEELWEKHIPGVKFPQYFEINVWVSNDDGSSKIENFEHAGLKPEILENVRRARYSTSKPPPPIQQFAIPVIQNGRDLMASAPTGSGKTAAFLLPILSAFVQSGRITSITENGIPAPFALIIEPTHELALQVKNEARKFASGTKTKVVAAYGKTDERILLPDQLAMLRNGCDILVATPGRLLFLVECRQVKLDQCKFLVLDEADRLLDDGLYNRGGVVVDSLDWRRRSFRLQINRLMLRMTPKTERQTLMFTATYPKSVQEIAEEYLNDYVHLHVGEVVETANTDIQQTLLRVEEGEKMDKLIDLITMDLKKNDGALTLVLVFANQKADAKRIAERLCQSDVPAKDIHANLDQSKREDALGCFKDGQPPVLVATSVAARGLDIERVDHVIKRVVHVINYDMPHTIEDYVFRIGRTGRMGNQGLATSFFNPHRRNDCSLAMDLLKVLRNTQQNVPDWFLEEYGGVENSFVGWE